MLICAHITAEKVKIQEPSPFAEVHKLSVTCLYLIFWISTVYTWFILKNKKKLSE